MLCYNVCMDIVAPRIRQLPQNIYNRIAAGEVVERPSSVVKELVENSIDAKATKITIEVEDGGVKAIKITDNGCGIFKDDLSLAFLAHATSKIVDIGDLDNVSTLGFRGEALASIASVSICKVVSRTLNSEFGSWIKLQNGEIVDSGECGCAYGTYIEVVDIFNNVPARKKFLKRSSTELIHITSFVEKLIISQPKIAFKYVSNGKVVYHSNGTNLADAIHCVWGQQVFQNLVQVQADSPYCSLSGFVSRVGFSRHNNSLQLLVVNGRVVVDSAVAKVVYNCFAKYLVSRQYPVFVLALDCDCKEVDVNVHPNKLEVRFAQKDRICGIVSRVVTSSMQQHQPFVSQPQEVDNLVESGQQWARGDINVVEIAKKYANSGQLHETGMFGRIFEKSLMDLGNGNAKCSSNYHFERPPCSNSVCDVDDCLSDINLVTNSDMSAIGGDVTGSVDLPFNFSSLGAERVQTVEQIGLDIDKGANVAWLDALLVGSVFDTYILLQDLETVYFVDQHAAHEKLIYDKLCLQVESNAVEYQDLLLSYVFDVSDLDKQMVLDSCDDLLKIGFEVREYGRRELAICSVPLVCSDINLKEFVGQMLSCLKDGRKMTKSSTLIKKLQQVACKSAVKGNCHLKKEEIQRLLQQYKASGSALFCPHGRPIVHTVTKYEIEKWFKRVV